MKRGFLIAQRLLICVFAEEPFGQFQVGTDLSTPPSLEGRHARIQLPLEVTLSELGKEIQGPAFRDIIVVTGVYVAAEKFDDAKGGRPIPLFVTVKSRRDVRTQTAKTVRHIPVVPDVIIRKSVSCAV